MWRAHSWGAGGAWGAQPLQPPIPMIFSSSAKWGNTKSFWKTSHLTPQLQCKVSVSLEKKGCDIYSYLLVASVHPWELSPHFFRWGSTERLVGTPQNAPFESLPEQQCHPEPFLQLPPGYLECVADQVVLEILRAPAHRRKVGDLQSLGWSYFLS